MSGSSSTAPILRPIHFVPNDTLAITTSYYDRAISRHWDILSASTPDAKNAKAYMFITFLPPADATPSSSYRNKLAEDRYDEIDRDLAAIKRGDLTDEEFEIGAVDTAKAVVTQIKNRQIAPPELNWMGTEAIIMLWVIGQNKLALTITDGEVGYTLRESGKTTQRRSNITLDRLDVLKLGQ